MRQYQLAQLSTLLQLLSCTVGNSLCTNFNLGDPAVIVSLIAVCTCKARILSWHARNGACPAEVVSVSGFLQPSKNHSRRLCKMLRSEWWHQARFFKDHLRVMCRAENGSFDSREFRGWCKTADQATEALWSFSRHSLPFKKKTRAEEGRLDVLGGAVIPEEHQRVLRLGPKFGLEPALAPAEKLATVRKVASLVPEDVRARCIAEGVDVLERGGARQRKSTNVQKTVDYLVSSQLKVTVADKEGHFVVMPEGVYNEKASAAVEKNFVSTSVKVERLKERAIALLRSNNLERLASSVKAQKGTKLDIFFNAKTHKPGIPFRAIVSERGTWQRAVSGFLMKLLDTLHINDPYMVPNSAEVVKSMGELDNGSLDAFSIDVEDLYYSMPHDALMSSVKKCITQDNDECAFIVRKHFGDLYRGLALAMATVTASAL
ncbi:uncharacterized protein LOC144166640 [Haemaphysalis longicornis]